MVWQFEVLLTPIGITEGPAWDGSGLLFTDLEQSHIMRYVRSSGKIDLFRALVRIRANGLMFDKAGRLYGCQQGTPNGEGGRRIVRYEPVGGVTVICDHYQGKKLTARSIWP